MKRLVRPSLRCCLFLFSLLPGFAQESGSQQQRTVRVLVTTDLHGHVMPYDYFTQQEVPRGLAKIATLIQEQRKAHPESLLIDVGDVIQGSALASAYQQAFTTGKTKRPEPMMLLMNALRFDATVAGNHDFNYGLKSLNAARKLAKFPWLSANTKVEKGATAAAQPFAPYLVKKVNGITVAIVGITTPLIPVWEKPEHYAGYRFEDGDKAARTAVDEVKAKHKPDVLILAVHAGLDRNLETGAMIPNIPPRENMVYQVAQAVPEAHAITFGHTHQHLWDKRIGNTVLLQPQNWGGSLGLLEFRLAGGPGKWRVEAASSSVIEVKKETAAASEIVKLAQPYHEAAEAELANPVATVSADLDARNSRTEDTALIDAVHEAQLAYTQADVSFAASFNPSQRVKKGPVSVRELAALYLYDNELYRIEGNGKMVRLALENAARFFLPCPAQGCQGRARLNPDIRGYNYDMAQGVTYEIDPNRPEGSRVVNLKYKGEPLRDDQPLRIAVNNYRYGGSGGYTMFRGAKITWQSNRPIRDLMVDYFREKKVLPATPDGNWKLVLTQ